MAESIEQLSFELNASALAEQERAVGSLRAGAGTVIGAASIAGSFLAARSASDAFDIWAVLATVAFAFCFASATWVLLPRELVFAFGGDELMADAEDRGTRDIAEAYRAAGSWIEPHLQVNRRKIDGLGDWLTRSCVLLAIEVILWILSLTD